MPRARGSRAPRMSIPPMSAAHQRELEGKQAVKRKAPENDDEEETICSICRFDLDDKVRLLYRYFIELPGEHNHIPSAEACLSFPFWRK